MAIILLTGGSGLIGHRLTATLQQQGHTVRWLSRSPRPRSGVEVFAWDTDRGTIDEAAVEGVEHVVHLSGSGIAEGRWTEKRLRELHTSRVEAADLVRHAVQRSGAAPITFISASGTGLYGTFTSDRIFSENDPAANDTIGQLVQDWEAAADRWAPLARVVQLRTPPVLAREGGALPRLAAPVRYGLGAALGTGRQWMPWVHIDDLVAAYVKALEDPAMHGPYNVVADEHVTNRELMHAVARTLHRPFFLPNVPAFALRLAFGEMASILLEGSRVDNARIKAAGMVLRHPRLATAMADTLQ